MKDLVNFAGICQRLRGDSFAPRYRVQRETPISQSIGPVPSVFALDSGRLILMVRTRENGLRLRRSLEEKKCKHATLRFLDCKIKFAKSTRNQQDGLATSTCSRPLYSVGEALGNLTSINHMPTPKKASTSVSRFYTQAILNISLPSKSPCHPHRFEYLHLFLGHTQ